MMEESLRRAARAGNVSDLYTLIKGDRHILRRVDEVEFAETPLHITAEEGCIDFAMEMMSLKPAFARKLNKQGLSPLHLAIEKGHKELVLLLIGIDKDLIRIKGKEGETPFHYAITREVNPELLPKFLEACPECIQDVTTENQTALHIAVRSKKIKALKLLCQLLKKTDYCQDVVNHKDRNGDTALHLAARDNQHEMIRLLLNCKADKHVANQAGSTPLDVARGQGHRESIRILRGFFVRSVSTFIYKSREQLLKYVSKGSVLFFQDMDNISSQGRSALLVILGLLLTTTYQASLSPPGGVLQGDISNSESDEPYGASIMSDVDFLLFYIPTCVVFVVAFFLTLSLLKPFPRGFRTALQILLAFLAICFDQSIAFMAPTQFASQVLNIFSLSAFSLMLFMCINSRVSKISVSILGCWFFPIVLIDKLANGNVIPGNVILGCFLFLFMYNEFWQGTVVALGYSLFDVGSSRESLKYGIIIPGCWLFLNVCRFCISWCMKRCNV